MHPPMRVFAAVAGIVLCGCSQKDAGKSDTTKAAEATATPASMASFDPATHTAVIHAKDFAFDAPDSITAGWTTFHFVNDGPNIHHVQLIRLDSGKTRADFDAAMKTKGPPPAWMVSTGGPNAPSPGMSTDAMINLTPGNYVMICFVDIPEHVPHFTKGMVHDLKVTAATGADSPEPAADATVTLSDYSFAVQGALTAGKHTIKVVNNGPQTHELELMRFLPGKSMKDLGEFSKTLAGPPPVDGLGGIAGEAKGMTQYFTVDLSPGNYVLICFVPDAKDGKAHIEHGMTKEFTIK
ncbi:MAG: hypothetical protein ABJF01_03935 [bacterium]